MGRAREASGQPSVVPPARAAQEALLTAAAPARTATVALVYLWRARWAISRASFPVGATMRLERRLAATA
jgi:hypothetical protein